MGQSKKQTNRLVAASLLVPLECSRGLPAPILFGASFPGDQLPLLRGAAPVGLGRRRARAVAAAVAALGRIHVAGARIRRPRLARAGSSRARGGHRVNPP